MLKFVHIENAFHDAAQADNYIPFQKICLTDTFQTYENHLAEVDTFKTMRNSLQENFERVKEQLDTEITVIIGNPPYSVGQKSANDNAQNEYYPKLEGRISETYAAGTQATNKNSLYDSYIKAFRWASDRIKDSGIIAFVTNAGWLDGAAMDGMRNCFAKEFTSIYVFNLRGNARTQGEIRRKEAGNVFGGGSRTPVSITILVKNPAVNRNAEIFYCDIGDYLSREEKLEKIKKLHSVLTDEFKPLTPNDKGDWINQRGGEFENYLPLAPEKKFDATAKSFFITNSLGQNTARDSWCWNFSKSELAKNMKFTIDFYNTHSPEDYEPTKITWNRSSIQNKNRGIQSEFNSKKIVVAYHRPFCKQNLYYDKYFNEMSYQVPKIFPTGNEKNLLIDVSGIGSNKNFSVMIFDKISCLDTIEKGQNFPLYWYEKKPEKQTVLFVSDEQYERRDGVTDFILNQARLIYGDAVTKEDIFYYVYGFLHLPAYREKFAADLKKSLPRIFLVNEPRKFWQLSKAGRQLAEIHLHYET